MPICLTIYQSDDNILKCNWEWFCAFQDDWRSQRHNKENELQWKRLAMASALCITSAKMALSLTDHCSNHSSILLLLRSFFWIFFYSLLCWMYGHCARRRYVHREPISISWYVEQSIEKLRFWSGHHSEKYNSLCCGVGNKSESSWN